MHACMVIFCNKAEMLPWVYGHNLCCFYSADPDVTLVFVRAGEKMTGRRLLLGVLSS